MIEIYENEQNETAITYQLQLKMKKNTNQYCPKANKLNDRKILARGKNRHKDLKKT